MKLPFINLSIDLSQNLTPEPCLTKTLSDIIKSQLQQSLNPKVSIEQGAFTNKKKYAFRWFVKNFEKAPKVILILSPTTLS